MIQKVKIELEFNRHSTYSEEYLLMKLQELLPKLEDSELLDINNPREGIEYEFELLSAKIIEDE